jgi:hypothetical protein
MRPTWVDGCKFREIMPEGQTGLLFYDLPQMKLALIYQTIP